MSMGRDAGRERRQQLQGDCGHTRHTRCRLTMGYGKLAWRSISGGTYTEPHRRKSQTRPRQNADTVLT